MHIFNGIVYGDNPMDSVEVTGVKPLDDMIMLLTFSNGETRVFDATILEGEAFEPLKDDDVFKHPVIEYGVVTWLDVVVWLLFRGLKARISGRSKVCLFVDFAVCAW